MKKLLGFYKTMLITLLIFIASSITALAAEKDFEVAVEKDYTSAKITITVPDDGNEYNATIISPDKKEYNASEISDNVLECIINEQLKVGKWKIHMVKTPPVEISSEDEDETATDPEETVDDMKDISIKFEGSMEKIADVSKDIVIATDIVGLKMYFRDDTFVAEWTDTTCGNVNIEVTDEKTNESLGKETVQGQSYELPLDTSVESIIVEIVPATSSNENGAEKQYVYKFDNHPDAEVTYEDIEITNKDEYGVHVKLNQSYAVSFICNGEEVNKTDMLQPGEYDFTVPTEVGENNYLTYIIDENGNMRSTAGFVEKDVIAPVLQLAKEYVQINTQDENISIEGKVEDYNTFTINDAEVNVEGDHTFKYLYQLKEGMNVIEIVATDEAGNVSQYTATINRVIPVETPIPWLKIIIACILVVMIGLYIFDAIKKYHGGDTGSKNSRKPTNKYKKMDFKNGLISDMLGLFLPVIIAVIIFKFVLCITVIQSASMEPTLMTGNTVVVNRLAYVKGDVKRGDVIFFHSDEFGEDFGKRVIGLPGDTVEFSDGYVVINGQYVDESAYIPEDVETNCAKAFTVPEGTYFVLGDNRENSNDSRYWMNPYISEDDIIGRYMGQIAFSFQNLMK